MTNETFYENENWEGIYNSLSPSFRSYLDTEEKFLVNRVETGDRVLDVGSGTGRTIDSMLTIFSSSHITGIDIAAATVTALRQKYAGNGNVKLEKASVCALPESLGMFSKVLLPFNLLGNLTAHEQPVALENILRVLEQTGVVIGSVYAESALDYQRECYSASLGFQIEGNDDRFIYCRTPNGNPFKSQRFTAAGIASLLKESGLELTELHRPREGFYYLYAARRQEYFAKT